MGTFTAAITTAQSRYPDLVTADALIHAKNTLRDLYDRAKFREKTVTLSSLVAGTREYAWDEKDIKAWEAVYLRDSSDEGTLLTIVSPEWLDIEFPGWRDQTDRSIPDYLYFKTATDTNTAQLNVGFHEIPETSSSASYPQVKVYCTSYADVDGADTIPPHFLSDEVVVEGIVLRHCRDYHIDQVPYREAEYEKQVERNIQHLKGFIPRVLNTFRRRWMEGRSRRG